MEVTLHNADEALKLGYTVNVELMIEQRRNVLYLPLGVMFPEGEDYFVYVITGSILEKRLVTLGFAGDRSVEVLDGLAIEDVVVLNLADVDLAHVSTPASAEAQA